MREDMVNKFKNAPSELNLKISANVKKNWRTPMLTELDYVQTSELEGGTGDGALGEALS